MAEVGERARDAHHVFDRAAVYAGPVIYPVLYVAAFPVYVLTGFGSGGRVLPR